MQLESSPWDTLSVLCWNILVSEFFSLLHPLLETSLYASSVNRKTQQWGGKCPPKWSFSPSTVPWAGKPPFIPYIILRHLFCLQLTCYLNSNILCLKVNQNHCLKINTLVKAIIAKKRVQLSTLSPLKGPCPNTTITYYFPRSIYWGATQVTQVYKVKKKKKKITNGEPKVTRPL